MLRVALTSKTSHISNTTLSVLHMTSRLSYRFPIPPTTHVLSSSNDGTGSHPKHACGLFPDSIAYSNGESIDALGLECGSTMAVDSGNRPSHANLCGRGNTYGIPTHDGVLRVSRNEQITGNEHYGVIHDRDDKELFRLDSQKFSGVSASLEIPEFSSR